MLKSHNKTLASRFASGINFKSVVTTSVPEESLIEILQKTSGRNNSGVITARHIGGRQKRYYRIIDFKRDKHNIAGKVATIEYDPNRNCLISLIHYADGEKRYILAFEGMKVGDLIFSGKSNIEVKDGNAMPVGNMPIGTSIHNIELVVGRGGIMARGAGGSAKILSKDETYVTIKLPSTESRKIPTGCLATVGVVSNIDVKNKVLGKAGRARRMGMRPKVRGVAQNPRTHPHGGGEGRSGEGLKQPKTPWGKPARGLKTRKKSKHSNMYIVERKKKKK